MLTRIVKFALVLAFLISPPIAVANPMSGGKWWHNPEVNKHLSLSDEEKSKLDKLFLQSRRKLIDLKRDVERERLEFEYLMEMEPLDEPAVMKQFDKMERARNALSMEQFRFLLQVRKTVGFERFQKLKVMHKEFRRKQMAWDREHMPPPRRPGPEK